MNENRYLNCLGIFLVLVLLFLSVQVNATIISADQTVIIYNDQEVTQAVTAD